MYKLPYINLDVDIKKNLLFLNTFTKKNKISINSNSEKIVKSL